MDVIDQLFRGNLAGTMPPVMVLFSLLLAFVLGQTIAWVYYITHQSLSYSRSFVQSLVLMTVIVSLVMVAIGQSLVTAFGLMGALAMIRFRHMIKDTRDIAFVSMSLVIGMAVGSQRFDVAIIGTCVISAIVLYLHWTAFGTHVPSNAFLRFISTNTEAGKVTNFESILKKYCSSFTLISVQQDSERNQSEYAFQLMIKNVDHNDEFVYKLESISELSNLSLVMQEQLLEV